MKRIHYFVLTLLLALLFSCKQADNQQGHSTLDQSEKTQAAELYRPAYHFTPDSMWMNDPNGLVYYEGEYHLFYQYYPDSTVWGPMHWGHAISTDLVHWKDLPIALYPDSLGYIFSGSAVIDWNNTSGLGLNDDPPMIAIFTHHNMDGERSGTNTFQVQSIAYSHDKGRTWEKYKGNPVVSNPGIKDFRDPKVIWHEASNQWIMTFAAYDKVLIYHSPNLIDWEKTDEFGIPGDDRLWECPDLFPIKVADTDEEKWVLIVSIQKRGPNGGTGVSYFVGDFDGKSFQADYKEQHWLDKGKDNYALVTFSDIPKTDGRRIAIGWMSNWQYAQLVPSKKWRSAMTIPTVLTLHKEGEEYRLRNNPVKELEKLEKDKKTINAQSIKSDFVLADEPGKNLHKLHLKFKKPNKGNITVRFSNTKGKMTDVGYEAETKRYFIDRRKSGQVDFNKNFPGRFVGDVNYEIDTVEILIYLDKSSIELFADQGRCTMTAIVFPDEPYSKIELLAGGQPLELLEATVTELEP